MRKANDEAGVFFFVADSFMSFTAARLRACLPSLPDSPATPLPDWWVGFSGGLDSTVLLHALVQLELPVRLHALHINHQLSPHADDWQAQCARLCAQWGVDFIAERVTLIKAGKGIEDAAREARYAVFETHLKTGDLLFTAHHADDQAETLLLRLLRGTGPRGLTGIAVQRSLGQGTLYRPLLAFSRAELETYAQEHGLIWVEDESNRDDHFDRNYLRNQVLPLLAARWPSFQRKWQQTAELCAQQEALMEVMGQEDMARADLRQERVGQSIDLAMLRDLPPVRQHNLVHYWLRSRGYTPPEQIHWQHIQRQLLEGRQDAEADVRWGEVSLRVFRHRLYLLPARLPAMKLVLVEQQSGTSPRLKMSLPHQHIAYRKGGERCQPAGRRHSQTLKKLLQEYALEPWLRDLLPLIYSHDQLVAVGDLWVCEGYVAAEGEPGYRVQWLPEAGY